MTQGVKKKSQEIRKYFELNKHKNNISKCMNCNLISAKKKIYTFKHLYQKKVSALAGVPQ